MAQHQEVSIECTAPCRDTGENSPRGISLADH
jgi:hypothetical protein